LKTIQESSHAQVTATSDCFLKERSLFYPLANRFQFTVLVTIINCHLITFQ